jgi:hypothetical protein
MPALFISYRRSDSSDITGRIFDRLTGHFGNKPVKVVRDVDSIPVGEDFRDVLRDKIESCDVVLVIIGPNWTIAKDHKGTRRLEDAADTVRIEIEQALELKKKVIPVCVTHAAMPTEDDLPLTLKKLAFRNGVQVRPDPDFNNDINRLIAALDKIFKDKQIAEAKPPTLPPPQRHFQIPEPPPPPVDTRRSSGSHGPAPSSSIGSSPFAAPNPAPVTAHAVEKTPIVPRRSTDSSPGTTPGTSTSASNFQPPTPNQSGAHPRHANKPTDFSGIFKSGVGVALLLTALVSLCMCGGLGFFFYIGSTVVPKEHEADIRADLQGRSAVVEHLGEIISVESLYGSAPSGPKGELGYGFTVRGTKGTATVYGHNDYSSSPSRMVADKMKLADGLEISLHDSYTPPSSQSLESILDSLKDGTSNSAPPSP